MDSHQFKGFSLTFIIFMMLITAVGCQPKPKEIVQTYGTGDVSRRHTEIDGKKEGKMTEYYKNGKIKGERLFENDLQVGKSIFYYPGGEVMEVQYFEEGKLQGGDTVFYENGKPQFVRTFNQGLLDGYVRKWGIDDSLIYEAKFANDELVEVKGKEIHPDSLSHKPTIGSRLDSLR